MVEVGFPVGYTLEDCVYALNAASERRKEVAHGYFNDVELFSSDTIKEIYEKVYGNNSTDDNKHIGVDLGDAEGDYSTILIAGRDYPDAAAHPIIIDFDVLPRLKSVGIFDYHRNCVISTCI